MKIGIIGFGAIGRFLAQNLGDEVLWVVDCDPAARKRLLKLKLECGFFPSLPEKCGGAELVVEAASQQAVPILEKCLSHSDVMILSVGALSDDALLGRLIFAAEKNNRKIYVPSGAIGGLDAIGAAARVMNGMLLETVKPPSSLGRDDAARTIVFEGSARQAVKLFPKNVNVSATLALAGIGFDRTKVRVVSDPAVKKNMHRVTVDSGAGKMIFEFENVPFEENPKTSKLAAMAALERIRKIGRALQV